MNDTRETLFAPEVYSDRRARFVSKLLPESVAIIVANTEKNRSNDTDYDYRQSSDVLYLSDFPEAESVLVLSNLKGVTKFTLFVQDKDALREQWTGLRYGVDGAKTHFGADEAFTIDKLEGELAKLVKQADNVYYKTGASEEVDKVWKATAKSLHNPDPIIHEMRLFKGPEEIDAIQTACDITASAHVAAMQYCRPGCMEYELKGLLEGIFTMSGALAPAYGSIVGGGANAWVLHYTRNNARLNDGDLVLVDAAAEYRGYAADITRTFPVNGKFTEAQLDIYVLVLAAQLAGIAAAKPGATLNDVHKASADVLRRGLGKLGILSEEMADREKALAAYEAAKAEGKEGELVMLGNFFPHGTSHWMGLDVHDVGTSGTRSANQKERTLEPGMIFTVEPGLYFKADDTRVPEKYRGIGVRIEDDVLITADGNKVLTAGVPKDPTEIERLMASGSFLALLKAHTR